MSLKIAIQKSGRLYKESISLLTKCGLNVDNDRDQLKAPIKGFDAEAYFLRSSDIPQYLADRVVDIAIIGKNVIVEKEVDVDVLLPLGFSQCRLSLASPKGEMYSSSADLQGKKIATSYPNSLRNYLSMQGIKAEIHTISGSVEIAPNIGLADAICDLVSSGATLFKNGLAEREVILQSEAVLAANKSSYAYNKSDVDELIMRVQSVIAARENRYLLFNIPNEKIEKVSDIIPAMKSPTIMPLGEHGWSSVHSVISQSDFWKVIGELRAEGAEGILVTPIQNMIV